MDDGGKAFRGDRSAAERDPDLDLDSELDPDLDLEPWRPAPGKRPLIRPIVDATSADPSGPTASRLVEQARLYLRSAARSAFDALQAAASRGDTSAAERAWSDARQTLGLVEQCLKDAEARARADADQGLIAEEVSATRAIRARLEARGPRLAADVEPERAIEAAWRDEAAPLAARLGVAPEIRADREARRRTEARGARGLASGDGIFLHPTRIAPGTSEGRRVLVHELVHVAQAKRKREGAAVADRAAAEAEAEAAATGQRLAPPVLGIDLDERAAADKDTRTDEQVAEPELPPDAPFLPVGTTGDVLIRIAWLTQGNAADISQAKIFAPTKVPHILRELKKAVFPWMPESAIVFGSKEVWLKGPLDPKRKVVRTSMGPAMFRLIGLPPDVEVEWIFTRDGAYEIISRGALAKVLEAMPDGMARGEIPGEVESLSMRRLYERAGLPPPRAHMTMLRDAVMRKSSAAYVTEYPPEYMRLILGPAWDQLAKRTSTGIDEADGEPAESPRGRFFDRPITGKVVVLGSAAWVGKELELYFSTRDPAGPGFVGITVSWVATPSDQPQQRLREGRTSHFAHHDPATWKVTFDKVGRYRIAASVDHQSYEPADFDDTIIEVKTEQQRLEEVENEAFADLGAKTSRKGRDEFFEDSWLDDRAGADKYSFGDLTEGEVPPDFHRRTLEERIAFIADDRARLRRLIQMYEGPWRNKPEARDMVAHARGALEGLDATGSRIRADGADMVPFEIRGAYLSDTNGVESASLNLIGMAGRRSVEGSSLPLASMLSIRPTVRIHDLSRLHEQRDAAYTGQAGNFREAVERAFVDLCKAYPRGRVSVLFEPLTDDTFKPSGKTMGFELHTGSAWKSVKSAVWDSKVQVAVNILAAATAVFLPGTALVTMTLVTAYNTVDTVDHLAELHRKGQATWKDKVAAGAMIGLDILPFVGRMTRVGQLGGKTVFALDAAQVATTVLVLTDQGVQQVQGLRTQYVLRIAELDEEIAELKRVNASDPAIADKQAERARLVVDARDASTTVFESMAASGAAMLVGPIALNHIIARGPARPAEAETGEVSARERGADAPHETPRRQTSDEQDAEPDPASVGERTPSSGGKERDPFAPDQVARNLNRAASGQPGFNAVAGYVKSRRTGLAMLERLMRGDLSALDELGIARRPGFDPSRREWGLGRQPDGKYVIIAGETGAIDWSTVAGVTPIAHSHPIDLGRLNRQRGARIDFSSLLSDKSGMDIDRSLVFPSPADLRYFVMKKLSRHWVAVPYEHVGGHQIVLSEPGTSSASQLVFELENGRFRGGVFSVEVTVRAGGETLWRGDLHAVFPQTGEPRLAFSPPPPEGGSPRTADPDGAGHRMRSGAPEEDGTGTTEGADPSPKAGDAIPDDLADQAASHGSESVLWAIGTLSHEDGKQLLGKLSRTAIGALRDIQASQARHLLDVFGRETLEKVAVPLGGRRLATEIDLVGPDTARDLVVRAAGKGKFDKLRRHADNLEAARADIGAARALESGSLILDSQVMIAVRKLMAGDSWSDLSGLEQVMVNRLRARVSMDDLQGDPPSRDLTSLIGQQDVRASNVGHGEIGAGTGVGALELTVSRTDPIYTEMLAELAKADPIGGQAGAADRAVVADAVLARNNGKDPPTLMTGDFNVYNRLARRYAPGMFEQQIVDGETEKLEVTIRREAASGFIVRIPDKNGVLHPLKVVPL